jgi:hypothetical protein
LAFSLAKLGPDRLPYQLASKSPIYLSLGELLYSNTKNTSPFKKAIKIKAHGEKVLTKLFIWKNKIKERRLGKTE